MQRQARLVYAKTFGLAGIITTISDLAQPLAPIATYVMAVSIIALILLILFKMVIHIWNEKMVVSTYFASGLFILSGTLYLFQIQSAEAIEHGAIASEIPEFSELQQWLGITTKQLESIAKSTSAINENVAKIERSVASVDESLQDIDVKLDNVKKETSLDPRKELANMGMRWEYDNFLDALRNKDERAIELYLKGGMKLRKDSFTDFVTNIYSKQVMDMLVDGNAIEGDFNCPSKISFYKKISKDSDKIDFVNRKCPTQIRKLVNQFDRLIDAQKKIIVADKNYNARFEADKKRCISELQSLTVADYVTEVENYNYSSAASTKKTVVTRLKGNGKTLKILAYKNVSPVVDQVALNEYYKTIEQDVEKAIQDVCMESYPEQNKKVIRTSKLEHLNNERLFLSKKYTVGG